MFGGEYFLSDYIYKIENFDGGMVKTGFNAEGYFDNYNMNYDEFDSAQPLRLGSSHCPDVYNFFISESARAVDFKYLLRYRKLWPREALAALQVQNS